MSSLSGRVAIVTGSARNIGRATALMLAREGCDVMIHARSDRAGVEETVALVQALGIARCDHQRVIGQQLIEAVPRDRLVSVRHIDVR